MGFPGCSRTLRSFCSYKIRRGKLLLFLIHDKYARNQNMSSSPEPYRVLARKYRPQTLSELVGQDLLVKTLTQAMAQNRLPHAFVLHGIRGVGKTTTARIIAKAVNCLQNKSEKDGTLTSFDPCGTCSSCASIVEDRHLDVVEMDAASRTGVDDVRELIDSVKYKAVHGRYKIYIIDEVHMLSKSAFNALLKTLEEPPPHVKFIFATTELKKIPDTVLSRCMRFDLARITPPTLFDYFKKICHQEQVSVDDEALALLVRAADGSARDGLSLLDQAISLSQGHITAEIIRDMLGLIDRGRTFSLFILLMEGKIPETLEELRDVYNRGGDPAVIIQELLDLTYWIICLKTAPALKTDITWPESDRRQGTELAQRLSLPTLMRIWQVLSKGYEEVNRSPLPNQAAEMVLVRLAYLGQMPSAEDLYQLSQSLPAQEMGRPVPQMVSPVPVPLNHPITAQAFQQTPETELKKKVLTEPSQNSTELATFQDLLSLVAKAREVALYSALMQDVHLVSFAPGRLEIRLNARTAKSLLKELQTFLSAQTNMPWEVVLSEQEGQKTLADQEKQQILLEEEQALAHPIVKELRNHFPQASVKIA